MTEGFRTPANPPHPSWASPMPPSPLRGEGYSRSVGSAQMSMAFPSSVMAAPCHLLPCGAKALAVLPGALKCRWPSPHPSRLTPCHLPPGEGFLFLTPEHGAGADMIRPERCPKNGIPQSASLTASPIPFVPSGHFPLTRGIGLAMTGFFGGQKGRRAKPVSSACQKSLFASLSKFSELYKSSEN